MKCSDIDAGTILRFLKDRASPAMTWDIEELLPDAPPKVVLAKLRKLIRKGYIDGCSCGCRGDFVFVKDQPTP